MGYWSDIKDKLDKVYDALQDEESRSLFDARVQYMISRNNDLYIDTIFELNKIYPKKWRCYEIERVLEDGQKIIIYGCGHDGKVSKRVLEICGYSIAYWCDSERSLWGSYIEGIQVISPESLSENYRDCLVIIGSKRFETEIRRRLFEVGFPAKNVFAFAYRQGVGFYGKQYFDMFGPGDEETFVDAGAYNGDTIRDFLSWIGDKKYKVYSIEPLADMCEVIKNKNISNVSVFNYAAWNKKEKLFFDERSRGSSVKMNENISTLWGNTIDAIVGDDNVSFIKMDIEGAELKALEGAKETILRCFPKLAICIYHKAEDIYEIGNYILGLNPRYKFYIRHYTAYKWETVLYAVIDESL